MVFEVSPSGSERVVYVFKGSNDGAYPSGPLLSLHGTLYGTTGAGGSGLCGTVFKVSTSGNESIVYSFTYASGCGPVGPLSAINGALYGVTKYGGGYVCGCGTIFQLTTTGKKKVIYRFRGGADGAMPIAGLIAYKGALYGTTSQGGRGCAESQGCGTVFKVTIAGEEQVLHAFRGGSDGANPEAGLEALRGTLYGTTSGGGGYSCGYAGSGSCGTVFKSLP